MKERDSLPEDQVALFEKEVLNHWPKSNIEEANRLVGKMVNTPSKLWFDLVFKAERHGINHWEILLKHKEQLKSIAAEAVADEDGQVVIK